jgi:formate dehydrogenase accessory protein FdhE
MNVWQTRRQRALALAVEVPHAEEILRCYAAVTEVQERLAIDVPATKWVAIAQTESREGPALDLGRLPLAEALLLFDDFLGGMSGVGTEVMSTEGARLAGAEAAERRALLEPALGKGAVAIGEWPFHVRAFLETIAATVAGRVLPGVEATEGAAPHWCRVCGAPPLVCTLRDRPGALGSRGLVCGLCGSEQRLRRLTCAFCGESSADQLPVHAAESVPHVRIDECRTCRRYLKTVDLRRHGDAVPNVDELATVELDIWAREQGLTKGCANLFGL